MTYIPKSKLNIKNTNGNIYQTKDTKKPYRGKYMELSNGKIFAGVDPLRPGKELELITPVSNNLGFSGDVRIFKQLKPNIANNITKIKDIPFNKNTPTEDDYTNGFFIRYFVRRSNEKTIYKEISKEVYDSLNEKKQEYDINLYKPGTIKWALTGNVRKINKQLLLQAERRFPNLSLLYPKLDEFNRAKTIINQFAGKGELFYRDNINREYIGPYHIHPIKGPMVGAIHKNTPHDRLIFAEDIVRKQKDEATGIQPTSGIAKPVKIGEFIPITPEPTPTPSPTTPSTPSAPSAPSYGGGSPGGGGGGY
tara:strand:- start:22 stop:945 length:924 start_codon:yes stop_codon:yes gene_type:complete